MILPERMTIGGLVLVATFTQVICVDVLKYYAANKHTLSPIANEPTNNASTYGQIAYSVANISTQFGSNTKFQARGMAHLYMLTARFIQLIGKDEAFPEGFLSISDENTIRIADIGREWSTLLRHYGPILIVVLSAVLFATVMPIIGLTFCCCRCVGRCGARSQPFDKRYDPCRRHFYGAILVAITVLISFAVICSFSTNEVLEEGVTNLPAHIRVALTDTELYLNNTEKEVQTLLVTNFKELEQTLSNTLHDSGKIVLDKLAQETKASVLKNLSSIVDGLDLIRDDLKKINGLTERLQSKSSLLDVGLRKIREEIAEAIDTCQREYVCSDFKRRYNVNDLSVETNFSELPNLNVTLQNLSNMSTREIRQEVENGIKEFEKIQTNVQRSVESGIPQIMGKINETGSEIEKGANEIISILEKMKAVIHEHIKQPVADGQQMITEFSPYRYYVCFGVSCALLVILVCLTFGVLCGCCGSRPNSGYTDDCCNKGAGSRYLMLAVWLMFLSSGVLMVIALVYFVAGVGTDKLICESLKNPHNSRTFSLLDQLANVDRFYGNDRTKDDSQVSLSTIIRACHKNESLYEVLQLYKKINIMDVKAYPEKFRINEKIRDLVQDIKFDSDIQIITQDASKLLHNLAESRLNNINFPAYTNVVGEKITSIDLMQLATAVNETAARLPSGKYQEIQGSLLNNALYLQTHQNHQVTQIINTIKELEIAARQLEEHLKFNHTSLKNAIEYLLSEVEQAQSKLKNEGQAIVTKVAKDFGEDFNNHIKQYTEKVVAKTQYDIGRCGPVSQAYNATVIAGCSRILLPFNGFWFSVGAAALLFLPAIIIAVILASLYQKSDPYPGPLVEAEYLYDVYGGDRDNVPLASVPDKKKKKNNKNRRSTDESCSNNSHNNSGANAASAAGGHSSGNVDRARSRHHGHAVSAVPLGSPSIVAPSIQLNSSAPPITPQTVNLETRFDDSAAKQRWDFPTSTAPTAQTAEYERPPPYYYPGPAPQGALSE